MTILVTGALGNAGAATLHALCALGRPDLRAADLHPASLQARFPGLPAVRFDFARPETFAPALEGVEAWFLLRPPQISNVKKYILPSIAAAQAAGVRQVVFLSLIGIEQRTYVPHYAIEQALRASSMSWTFLRASFFMQNLSTIHRDEIRQRSELYLPVGQGRTSFVDVRDLGAVAALALTQPGHALQAYDLTGPQALTYDEAAACLSRILGRRIVYRSPHPAAFLLRNLRAGRDPIQSLVMTFLYHSTRHGMGERVTGEVARLLGRPPRDLETFVRDHRAVWE